MRRRLKPRSAYIIGIPSDIHLAIAHQPTLECFKDWVADVKPDELYFNGDTFDFAQLGRYPKGAKTAPYAIEEVKMGVEFINWCWQHTGRIRMQKGNHCKRWERVVYGDNGMALKDAKGLKLEDQCLAYGMDPRTEWFEEKAATPGIYLAENVGARHGDLQSGKNGTAPVNMATARLNKNQGVSEFVGHHHRVQLAFRTAWERTSFVMTLPTMANFEDYMPGADWQHGWGTLTVVKPGRGAPEGAVTVTAPGVILVQRGQALWGDRVYGRYTP